ncbi:MAG: FAD-dependent oxidoreductase [Candidatus Heimdallarchaeota archaeon]
MGQSSQKSVLHYREDTISNLQSQEFDILVVGGGITGAGVARDAALRGYSVALAEKLDFGSGTSSGSSKLVHAGLRYVPQKEFRFVREASRERRKILEMAPHVTSPLKFFFPFHSDIWSTRRKIKIGIWLYDILAGFRNHMFHKFLGIEKALRLIPTIREEEFQGAGIYGDGRMDDARLSLEVILSAQDHGASVLNYCEVVSFKTDQSGDKITSANVHDKIKDQKFAIKTRAVVIACGHWTDEILHMLDPNAPPRVRITKGIHLITKKFYDGEYAVVIPIRDKRVNFVIPFGDFNLVGTTDTDYTGDLDFVPVLEDEIDYIVDAINFIFPGSLSKEDIVSAYSGLRPLIISPDAKSESDVSRKHEIFAPRSNLFAITGGKFTTFRAMAKDVVDRLGDFFGKKEKCMTDETPLHGWSALSRRYWENWKVIAVEDMKIRYGLSQDIAIHLLRYGENYEQICQFIKENPELDDRISSDRPYILAEVDNAVRNEQAVTLNDFMLRRTQLQLSNHQGLDCIEPIVDRMAYLLGWAADKKEREIASYKESLVWSP